MQKNTALATVHNNTSSRTELNVRQTIRKTVFRHRVSVRVLVKNTLHTNKTNKWQFKKSIKQFI
jgi:hypothetical protein